MKAASLLWIKYFLIAFSIISIAGLILIPLIFIFSQAFSNGIAFYLSAISHPSIFASLKLTLYVATISTALNLLFGFSAGWYLGKFPVIGRSLWIGLIELPLSVSPVTAGLMFFLLFGHSTPLGSWLHEHGVEVIFAVPGIVLATTFVTLPYIAREIIPLLQETGNDEEEAALLLGAGGIRTFFQITLPKIKWGVFYGLMITAARAIGEFGAVSVVSGHLIGKTDTLTLQIEMLYNDYNYTQSFAVSSLLTLFALFSLGIKSWIEHIPK